MEPIAAIATGNASSAIGVVRLSGSGCFTLCDRVFRPKNGKAFADQSSHQMIFGDLLDAEGRMIDQGLAVRFPGRHSYTGEDSAEFHCHGSPVVLRELLSALFSAGARQAKAGEFTRRAFLNGRMDLTQAEAVIDLIDAETAPAARNAASQLNGSLRSILEPVQSSLLDITSRFYAVVDYPDEDIEDIQPAQIKDTLKTAETALTRLLATSQRGKLLKSGIRTAIVGRPNAGKSSLLNALAGYDRAIVTDIPGTTRDTVEESVLCGGTLLRLIDTAGLHNADDPVERLGVERSRAAMESADLVLAVIDGSAAPTEEDLEMLMSAAKRENWILIRSKKDITPDEINFDFPLPLSAEYYHPAAVLKISSITGEGIDTLESAIADLFPIDRNKTESLLTDARQEDAVRRAITAIHRASDAFHCGLTPDAVLTDVEESLDALGELTGRTAKEKIVDAIFSRFCVGK